MIVAPLAALSFALFSLLASNPGSAQAGPPWAQGFHSRARLIEGGNASDSRIRLAGIELELDQGYKTYWRHPGESGLPPAFDWSQSQNVANVEVLWPAPERFEDASGISYGYLGRVVLPLRITARDAGKPFTLALKIDYGVCKDICIPAQAMLTLEPASKGPAPLRPLIEEALARVPERQPLGGGDALSVLSVEPRVVDGKALIAASVRTAGAEKPTLFVEAPETWYLAAEKGVRSDFAKADGATGVFLIDVLERPRHAAATLDLRLTLVAGARAIETAVSLDTTKLPR